VEHNASMQEAQQGLNLAVSPTEGFCETLLKVQSDVGEGLLVVEEGRILFVNEAFCRMSGYGRADFETLPMFLELLVPDQRRMLDDWMRRRLCGEAAEDCCELVMLHESGRRVHVRVAIRPLERQNRAPQLIVIVRDITEHKLLEAKLKSNLGTLVAMHEAGRVLGSTLELEEIAARLLKLMRRIVPLGAASIKLLGEDGELNVLSEFGSDDIGRTSHTSGLATAARRGALQTKEPRLFRSAREEGYDMPSVGLCLPLLIQDRVSGVLEAYGSEALAENAMVDALEGLTGQAANALENARLYRELATRERRLHDLVGKLLVAQEEERRRVACDVHDGLTQVAVATHQHLQAYAEDYPPWFLAGQEKLEQALELAGQTVREARRTISDLRPVALEHAGLADALRLWVDSLRAEGWEIGYEETLGSERLPAETETALYRVAQESLTNVRKHARTTRVQITLGRSDESVRLEVRDWGRGFNGVPPEDGLHGEQAGFGGMRERIELLGGELRIYSRPGVGSSIIAEIPLVRAIPGLWVEPVPGAKSGASPARLLIADDHALVREGLRSIVENEPNLHVIAEAADGREAFELCRRLRPDLVLMDSRMPKIDGTVATQMIKAENCATNVLILSAYESVEHLLGAVRAGASGYVLKGAPNQRLLSAIRRTLNGESPINQELAMRLLRRLAGEGEPRIDSTSGRGKRPMSLPEPLTPRELEVVRLLAKGQTNRQISQELVVSAATVKVHVEHILAKFDVCDRTQAAVRASEAGLLDPTG
jgi:PAS domain S-box-containing protein